MHLVSAVVACDGAASGLCVDEGQDADCLLSEVRPAEGGDAGGEADDLCGGAAGVREDPAGGGGQVCRDEEEDFELGAGGWEGTSRGDSGWKDPGIVELEAGEQAGVLEDS